MGVDQTGGDETGGRRRFGTRRGVFELAFTVAVAIILALAVQSFALKPYEIPTGSMRPTLQIGQRVIVDRFTEHLGGDPKIGDVVVFHPPLGAVPEEQDPGEKVPRCGIQVPAPDALCSEPSNEHADRAYIKRVVALPGDRLKVVNGIPIVNGEPLKGDWNTIPCKGAAGCDFPEEIVVPPEHYFMMGDNRPGSDDSRYWGPVPRDWIIGKAVLTYWPPDRVGGI
jgi:signal peptidase I